MDKISSQYQCILSLNRLFYSIQIVHGQLILNIWTETYVCALTRKADYAFRFELKFEL
jgi:hypothetical protein